MENSLTKLNSIKQLLAAKFHERENEVEALLLAILARQHILLIGPAGTAKSALATETAKSLQGISYFQWLLTRFSTPEELFGPLSLQDLEQGVYKRNTKSKMPEAHIVFLDELFKANSAILNSLLTIINERIFYNSAIPAQVPLMTVIGASNEFPEEDEGLDALYDRFLLRFEIGYLVEDQHFIAMMKDLQKPGQMPTLTMEELLHLQQLTNDIQVGEDIYMAMSNIRRELRDEGIQPSDRRFKQALSILQARALTHNRQAVSVDDLSILENVLWDTVEQKETVSIIVRRHAQDTVIQMLDAIQNEANEIYHFILRDNSVEAGFEATEKMKALETELRELKKYHGDRDGKIAGLLAKVKALHQDMLNTILEPMYFEAPQAKKRA